MCSAHKIGTIKDLQQLLKIFNPGQESRVGLFTHWLREKFDLSSLAHHLQLDVSTGTEIHGAGHRPLIVNNGGAGTAFESKGHSCSIRGTKQGHL